MELIWLILIKIMQNYNHKMQKILMVLNINLILIFFFFVKMTFWQVF